MKIGNRTQVAPGGSKWKAHLGEWAKYTAAAGAALSMATGADAGIVTGSPKTTVTPGTANGNFGLGQATFFSSNSFKFFASTHTSHRRALAYLHGLAFIENGVTGGHGLVNPVKFAPGQAIQGNVASAGIVGRKRALLPVDDALQGHGGNFFFSATASHTHTTGYVGFVLSGGSLAGDPGWLKVIVSDGNRDGFVDQVKVVSWAYETSGGAITAGETTDAPATPEPGTAALGVLAAGAAGILALRRRRKELQAK